MIRFRRCDDVFTIKSLDLSCFPWDEPYPFEGAAWWAGYDGDRPVAYCGIQEVQGMAFLCRAGVLRTHRGLGLQRKMVRLRERWAKKNAIGTVISYTALDNVVSSNNLARCGFKLYVPQDKYSGDVNYWIKYLEA